MSRPRLLITSGPTREYLDPVRYLSNGSSGQMGRCLSVAAMQNGYDVVVVTGPVSIQYPESVKIISVMSTQEMHDAVLEIWPDCEGLIAAAAPCDFRPTKFSESKIKKSSAADGMTIDLIENPDILAEAGRLKNEAQWTIGFALETENGRQNALGKMERKNCDMIVLNSPSAIDSSDNSVVMIDRKGQCVLEITGSKQVVAEKILEHAPVSQ